jgi:hypothetical protein
LEQGHLEDEDEGGEPSEGSASERSSSPVTVMAAPRSKRAKLSDGLQLDFRLVSSEEDSDAQDDALVDPFAQG